jgi:hypothetical protein
MIIFLGPITESKTSSAEQKRPIRSGAPNLKCGTSFELEFSALGDYPVHVFTHGTGRDFCIKIWYGQGFSFNKYYSIYYY